jgi:hypothetical protein
MTQFEVCARHNQWSAGDKTDFSALCTRKSSDAVTLRLRVPYCSRRVSGGAPRPRTVLEGARDSQERLTRPIGFTDGRIPTDAVARGPKTSVQLREMDAGSRCQRAHTTTEQFLRCTTGLSEAVATTNGVDDRETTQRPTEATDAKENCRRRESFHRRTNEEKADSLL